MKRSTLIAGGVALALVLAAGGGYAYSLTNARTTVGVATAQRDHAFNRTQLGAVRVDPRSHTAEAVGFVDIAADDGL